MFFKLMSGDLIFLEENDENKYNSKKKLSEILNIPRFRINLQYIDDNYTYVFINDHPHRIQKFFGGLCEGFVDNIQEEYQCYAIRVSRLFEEDDNEYWTSIDFNYYTNITNTKFLIDKDILFRRDENDNMYFTSTNYYDTLIDAISNTEIVMNSDTFQYLLDEILYL